MPDRCLQSVIFGETMVPCVLENKDKIKKCGKIATPLSASELNRTRTSIMIEVGRLLMCFLLGTVYSVVFPYIS
jgi:hypothetical protein